jgi:hypothetical protein
VSSGQWAIHDYGFSLQVGCINLSFSVSLSFVFLALALSPDLRADNPSEFGSY